MDQDGRRSGKIKAVITIMTCLEEAITVQRHLTKNIQTEADSYDQIVDEDSRLTSIRLCYDQGKKLC